MIFIEGGVKKIDPHPFWIFFLQAQEALLTPDTARRRAKIARCFMACEKNSENGEHSSSCQTVA
jgi:hypothetical protein